jgi:hypothetical protein
MDWTSRGQAGLVILNVLSADLKKSAKSFADLHHGTVSPLRLLRLAVKDEAFH